MESEKDTERYLKTRVEKFGGQCFKWSAPMTKGVPDRICIFPEGRILFVEVKSEGKRPTVLQEHILQLLRSMGCNAGWVSTKAMVDQALEDYI